MQGVGCRVQGVGCRVKGVGCRVSREKDQGAVYDGLDARAHDAHPHDRPCVRIELGPYQIELFS